VCLTHIFLTQGLCALTNLSPAAIAAVKRLVEVDHVAATQDALVEHAIEELDRIIRDAHEARLWSEMARDTEFQAELVQIDGVSQTMIQRDGSRACRSVAPLGSPDHRS
jgi:hypothetical protein